MTKLIVQTQNDWARRKIETAIASERTLLQKAVSKTEGKVKAFEQKHGSLDRGALYGMIDDMELLEWEGENEILEKMKEQLTSLQEIAIEYQ